MSLASFKAQTSTFGATMSSGVEDEEGRDQVITPRQRKAQMKERDRNLGFKNGRLDCSKQRGWNPVEEVKTLARKTLSGGGCFVRFFQTKKVVLFRRVANGLRQPADGSF